MINIFYIFFSIGYNKEKGAIMKKTFKITAITLASIIGLVILLVLGYVIYLSIQYYRIEDNLNLEISNNRNEIVSTATDYTITTYNIGFGAYNHDFSFFMDSGKMLDGTEVTGKNSTAKSKDVVINNTTGIVNIAKALNSDFYLFQEVDTKGTRSHNVNQLDMLKSIGDNYGYTYAINFHSAYLLYPFNDPHGANTAGVATFSRYKINSSTRKSYPIDESFPNKYFDLDRCFSINRISVNNGKELVIINSHMSAYDKGGKIRQKQLALLNSVLTEEYEKGNYVIAGGDFNHDIADSIHTFETQQYVPEWVFQLEESDLAPHFRFASSTDDATCRSTDIPYTKGVNYSAVLDGYIISDNVSISNITNLVNGESVDFMYSDHNPATLTFQLI